MSVTLIPLGIFSADHAIPIAVLNVLFTRALASRLSPTAPLIPAAACPGYCSSNLIQNGLQEFSYIYAWLMDKTLSRPVEHGSRQLLLAALGPDGDFGSQDVYKLKEAFVMHSSLREPSDFVLSPEGRKVQDRLWVSRTLYYAFMHPARTDACARNRTRPWTCSHRFRRKFARSWINSTAHESGLRRRHVLHSYTRKGSCLLGECSPLNRTSCEAPYIRPCLL